MSDECKAAKRLKKATAWMLETALVDHGKAMGTYFLHRCWSQGGVVGELHLQRTGSELFP